MVSWQKKSMFLLTLTLLPLLFAIKPPKTQLDGVWQFKLEDSPPGMVPAPGKIFVLKGDGPYLMLVDPQTHATFAGRTTSNSLMFDMPTWENDTKNWPSGQHSPWNGSLSGRSISGTTKMAGKDIRWRAVKLGSVWECKNHNPNHIATTEEEMRSFTKQNSCMGWHKLSY